MLFMRKKYPSDISRHQFKTILPLLLKARRQTRPRTVDLYEVFCGLLYLLKSGCQWRMIPRQYPKWKTIYSYFEKWSMHEEQCQSILEQVLKKISWRGAYAQWSERENKFCHRGRTKC